MACALQAIVAGPLLNVRRHRRERGGAQRQLATPSFVRSRNPLRDPVAMLTPATHTHTWAKLANDPGFRNVRRPPFNSIIITFILS